MAIVKPTIGQAGWGLVLNAALDTLDSRDFRPRGNWATNTEYLVNDLVQSAGSTFRVKVAHTSSAVPTVTTPGANYEVFAAAGPQGPAGPTYAFAFPYTMRVDARESAGKANAPRPDAPIVVWGIDPDQANPVNLIEGGAGVDPKYQGDETLTLAIQ